MSHGSHPCPDLGGDSPYAKGNTIMSHTRLVACGQLGLLLIASDLMGHFGVPSAGAQTVIFEQPWVAHGGPLRVSTNGHYLEYPDGTGFVWIGDLSWSLYTLSPAEIDAYMRLRREEGYSLLYLGVTSEAPFLVGDRPYTSVELDDAWWKRIDALIHKARTYGLHVLIDGGYSKALSNSLFADSWQGLYDYGKAIADRYKSEPHVLWVPVNEYSYWSPTLALTLMRRVAQGIHDAYGNGAELITWHPGTPHGSSSLHFHDDALTAFNGQQTRYRYREIPALTRADWLRQPPKPVANLESYHEALQGEDIHSGWGQRLQAYWSLFSGAMGYTYCAEGVLTIQPGVSPDVLNLPGSWGVGHAGALLRSKPIQSRVPDQTLVVGEGSTADLSYKAATRAADGSWAFVYSTNGSAFQVRMSKLSGPSCSALWYNPRTGRWHVPEVEGAKKIPFATGIPCGAGAPDRDFVPPGHGQGPDWVLVLERSASTATDNR